MEMATDYGLIGMGAVSVGSPTTTLYGGMKPITGTNPMAFGIPTRSGKPIILDFATADGTALAAHDHTESSYGLTKSFRESTWADVVRAGRKYLGTYTVLRSQDVLRLTAAIAQRLEYHIATHPEQWTVFQTRWPAPRPGQGSSEP